MPVDEVEGAAREADAREHVSGQRRMRAMSQCANGSIRFAPPLVISEEDVRKAVKIIAESLEEFDTIEKIPGDEGDEHDTKIELDD